MVYNAANFPSLADATSLSVSLSDSDIVMVKFLLGGRTSRLAHLRGKAEMATATLSLSLEYSE